MEGFLRVSTRLKKEQNERDEEMNCLQDGKRKGNLKGNQKSNGTPAAVYNSMQSPLLRVGTFSPFLLTTDPTSNNIQRGW